MTDRPRVASDAPPAKAEQRMSSGGYRYFTFAVAVLLTGVAASVVLGLVIPGQSSVGLIWLVPVFAAAFLLAEQLTIDTNIRRIDWTISFTEIPLVIGLLVAPFWVVLLAHVVAGLLTQLRRRALTHVVYNGGAMCLEIVFPFAVYYALLGVAGVPSWVFALLATLTSPLVSVVLALGALRAIGTGLRAGEALRLAARTLVVGLLNASVGLIGFEVATLAPWGAVLVVALGVSLAALYFAYSGLLREQRDLETLSDFSLAVARSGHEQGRPKTEPDAAEAWYASAHWQSITERIRDQLGADRVVLHLRDDGMGVTRTLVAGSPLPQSAPADNTRKLLDDPMLQLPGGQVHYYRMAGTTPAVARSMHSRDIHEALVVQLSGANQMLGAVEAHDRASRWRGFSSADVRLLRTVASHLATSIDNRRLLARLRHDAYHDPLTGLLNRLGFTEVAATPLAEHANSVVLRADLDVLSTVSDALGYAWGDRMLLAAGSRLREIVGDGVPMARLEGGAFAALLLDHTPGQAHEVAERLQASLSAPYPVERLTVEAGAVLGYAAAVVDAEKTQPDVDTLLQRADVALRASRSSSSQIRGYSPSMGQIFLRRFQLVTQFRQALENGQVRVHYQPKLALANRHVIGVEALVRWRHPEYGDIDPDEFVPAVEATGLVDALTSFVTDRALTKVRQWLDRGIRMSAAVNLSVRNLANADFPEQVADALVKHDVPAHLLTFELTESQVMSDPDRALPVLRRLHDMGVVLAVDDFGTGYSSLSYLRQLPVDEVKIDKSFVLGMGTDLGDLAVVRSIVELGHSLGLSVVAEGVEDDAARDALLVMQCDTAQGYLISRPLSEDRLEAWLQARTTRAMTSGVNQETVFTLVH
jgi:diguanylate cyclase (GGDEF)-like protein